MSLKSVCRSSSKGSPTEKFPLITRREVFPLSADVIKRPERGCEVFFADRSDVTLHASDSQVFVFVLT